MMEHGKKRTFDPEINLFSRQGGGREKRKEKAQERPGGKSPKRKKKRHQKNKQN